MIERPCVRLFRRGGEMPRTHRIFVIVGQDHSAAAGSDVLVAVEREHRGMAEGAASLPLPGRAERFGCVLDDDDAIFRGYRKQRGHMATAAEDVDAVDLAHAP